MSNWLKHTHKLPFLELYIGFEYNKYWVDKNIGYRRYIIEYATFHSFGFWFFNINFNDWA